MLAVCRNWTPKMVAFLVVVFRLAAAKKKAGTLKTDTILSGVKKIEGLQASQLVV